DAVVGGKSVGVPGVVRMLEMVHREEGKLPWRELFQPAIALAENGFPISPRLYQLLSREKYLQRFPNTRDYFYLANGQPKPVGSKLVNKPLAGVLRSIANQGADAFYNGEIAKDIVTTVTGTAVNAGDLTLADLANYQAKRRDPVCGSYRVYQICSMGPPSSGGITMLQMLGILQNFDLASLKSKPIQLVHLFSEAGRLAYADRNQFLADPDFVTIPTGRLLDRQYLRVRGSAIDLNRSMGKAAPGNIVVSHRLNQSINWLDLPATTHFSIIDKDGNAVSMTSTVESGFGSRLMVRGFLLNNQLTDFNFVPEENGKPVVNRVEAWKRPRSSMSPTIVFNAQKKPILITGSPGGSGII
ncbi:MAG TPA: gamma-glutamyltransferase family protein, partial [Phormidium sp.]